MNQILVSEKFYLTPEVKRKKIFFKIEFILSVFLLCLLSSYYIYAEYDRNKNEKVSQEILGNMEFKEEEIDTIVVVLNSAFSSIQEVDLTEPEEEETELSTVPDAEVTTTENGTKYWTIGVINIPEIEVNYPILETEDIEDVEEILKMSPCKFWGGDLNKEGNVSIVGHNYRNSRFFSKVPTLENGSIIEIIDMYNNIVQYSVYDKYIVDPEDTRCTNTETNGTTEITIITCTNDSKQRVIVKARAID